MFNYLRIPLILLGLTILFNLSTNAQSLNDRQIYVIVHGAWGGSWSFKAVDSIMTAHGHEVYRPSLTGLGERAHLNSQDIGLSLHIKDVLNYILYEDLHDVILVGHSYGGMVISGVADAIPGRIKRLIYFEALVPEHNENVLDIFGKEKAAWAKSMVKNGYMVPPWIKSDQKLPNDVPQSFKTFTEPISLKNKATKIPTTFVLTVEKGKKTEDDDFYTSALRAKEKGWSYYEMISDHNPQWSATEEMVELIERDK